MNVFSSYPLGWSRKTVAVLCVFGAAAAVAAAVTLWMSSPQRHYDAREQARGVTDVVTVASQVPAADGAVGSVPRPAVLPPVISASGQCKDALDAVRQLMDAVPSGLMPLTPDQQRTLTAGLARIGGAGQAGVCASQTADAFRAQELAPWLQWAPPAASSTAAASAH